MARTYTSNVTVTYDNKAEYDADLLELQAAVTVTNIVQDAANLKLSFTLNETTQ